MLPANAPVWLDRLLTWLEPFEHDFGHVAQRGAFRRYLLGLLSDSRRKSMSAMLARISEPGSYEAFQHFITDAPWVADDVWRRLRATIPEREGVLILDGTSFPKQGTQSVGVARQYCGTLGKIANCQVAVTVALWTGARAWMLGARMYLPEAWLTREARQRARIPTTVRFQEKWRLALTLLRQVRTSGITVTAVLGDAEFGDNATLRRTLHRAKLPYALGVSSTLTVFPGTPALTAPAPLVGKGRPRTRRLLAPGVQSVAINALAADQPAKAWRRVTWRNGTNRPWRARFFAHRVTPAHDWRERRVAPEVWLLCERDLGSTPRTKYYLVDLPATTSLKAGPPALGDRAAVSRAQGRTRARSLRGPFVAGMATPRRADRARLCLAASRTPSSRRPIADAAHRAGGHHRNPHRAFLGYASALLGHHAQTQGHFLTDLTK